MTAGEILSLVDGLRPNQYQTGDKLRWLRRLDGQILAELEETHQGGGEEAPVLPAQYAGDTELLAPFPYAEELYSAYLFCQIDLHNAEIQKYNQSITLLAAAWRQLADWLNRRRLPRGAAGWKF